MLLMVMRATVSGMFSIGAKPYDCPAGTDKMKSQVCSRRQRGILLHQGIVLEGQTWRISFATEQDLWILNNSGSRHDTAAKFGNSLAIFCFGIPTIIAEI